MDNQMESRNQAVKGWRNTGLLAVLAAPLLAALPVSNAVADIDLSDFKAPPISIGAGLRSDFTHTSGGDTSNKPNDFTLDSVRLYFNGSVLPDVKFMLNTEYTGADSGDGKVQVIDAVGRFEFNDQFNVWAGRFLPPSDRANLYGPYYANNFKIYEDGVQDGYPFQQTGRDDGVAYWGTFGIAKVSAGVFDVPSTYGRGEVLSAARLQLDFWDPEPGYYLNGTYYGEKNLLAVGVAGQTVADKHAYSADFLLEKNFGIGTLSLEGEAAKYDKLGGYGGITGNYIQSNGWYGLAAWLFPQKVGIGRIQLLGKYGAAQFDDTATPGSPEYAQKTTEADINYIIKTFNARFSLFFKDDQYSADLPSTRQVGVGMQLQI
jgi:hypothetical protein